MVPANVGRGDWDDWAEEWAALYPLEEVADGSRRLFQQLQQYLPIVGRTLLTTKFEVLNGRTIAELFDLAKLAPVELKRAAGAAGAGDLPVDRLTPCIQLAVFRVLRDHGKVGTDSLDRLMTRWLVELGKQRNLNM